MTLYFIAPENPGHKAWGIYTRKTGKRLFRLSTIMLDRAAAITQAEALKAQDPELELGVQGAATASALPEKFAP